LTSSHKIFGMPRTSSETTGNHKNGKKRKTTLNFEKYATEGNEFINRVAEQLGTKDRNKAARITRSVLHAVRDRLPVDECLHLSQQLPMAIKAVFIDQYDPSIAPVRLRTKTQFLDYLASKDHNGAIEDFPDQQTSSYALQAVFTVLEGHISEGQIDQVKAMLPHDIMELIDPDYIHPQSKTTNMQNRNTRSGRPYGDDYNYEGRGYESRGPRNYGMEQSGRGSYGSDYYGSQGYGAYEGRDEGWIDRAGDRIREGWQNLKHRFRDDDDRGYYNQERGYNREDDRNWLERAGDKISEKWHDMTDRDRDRDYDRDRYYNDYSRYTNRGTDMSGRSYEGGMGGYNTGGSDYNTRNTGGYNTSSRGYDYDNDRDYQRRRNYRDRGYGNY
jgi:uncharacterized protein (DUF2267 family)